MAATTTQVESSETRTDEFRVHSNGRYYRSTQDARAAANQSQRRFSMTSRQVEYLAALQRINDEEFRVPQSQEEFNSELTRLRSTDAYRQYQTGQPVTDGQVTRLQNLGLTEEHTAVVATSNRAVASDLIDEILVAQESAALAVFSDWQHKASQRSFDQLNAQDNPVCGQPTKSGKPCKNVAGRCQYHSEVPSTEQPTPVEAPETDDVPF